MEEELAGFVKEFGISREIRRGPLVIRETPKHAPSGPDRGGESRGGTKSERPGLVLCVSGVGKVLTAAAVQFCIDRYAPSAIIHTGIAGALASLPIGDILVAESSLQWDFDARPFARRRGEIPRAGIRDIPADPDLLRAVTALRPKGFRIHRGRIVTGDTVLYRKNDGKYSFLTEELGASAVDMESGSAAIVAAMNGIRFLSFKVISDDAEGGKPSLFGRFVRKSSGKCVTLVNAAMKELVRDFPGPGESDTAPEGRY